MKSLSAGQLMEKAIKGEALTTSEALAVYGNEKNWEQDHMTKKCRWVWKGPVICAYELGQRESTVFINNDYDIAKGSVINGDGSVIWFKCVCGKANILNGFKYCPDCGKTIIWGKKFK